MMGADDPTVIALEVSGGLGAAGLILVFMPFFFERLQQWKDAMAVWQVKFTRALFFALPVAVASGAATSTSGLLTLWDKADLATPTAILFLLTIWIVVLLAILAAAYQLTRWE